MNVALIGKRYPEIRFSVTEDRVRRFAAAVGDPDPHVPPTFLTTAELEAMAPIIADPELGLDFSRVVHGEQEYDWTRPLRVGEELVAEALIAAIRAKGGHEWLVVESRVRDAAGRPVALARNTLIVRSLGA